MIAMPAFLAITVPRVMSVQEAQYRLVQDMAPAVQACLVRASAHVRSTGLEVLARCVPRAGTD